MRDRQMTGTKSDEWTAHKIIDIEIGEQDEDIGQVLTRQLPGRYFRMLSNISQFSQKHSSVKFILKCRLLCDICGQNIRTVPDCR